MSREGLFMPMVIGRRGERGEGMTVTGMAMPQKRQVARMGDEG